MYPHERSLVEAMKDRPFALVGVNSDVDKAKLEERIAAESIRWRSFWNGPEGTNGPISKAWRVSGWPTTIVIDHRGVIRHKSHGGDGMDAAIARCVRRTELAIVSSICRSSSSSGRSKSRTCVATRSARPYEAHAILAHEVAQRGDQRFEGVGEHFGFMEVFLAGKAPAEFEELGQPDFAGDARQDFPGH